MKRFLIFSALFPPLAGLVFVGPDVWSAGGLPPLRLILDLLPLAYMGLLVPAWLSAGVDWALPKHRLAGTTIAGAVIAELTAFYFGVPFGGYKTVLMIGLVGAIPAALCSWLSNRQSGWATSEVAS